MKKFNVFACLFYGTVIAGCIYLGFFLGSIFHPGMTISTFVPALKGQMENPFNIKVTACTPYTMAAVFLTALLSVMVQKTNKKNYRFGKEHGSARWVEAAMLTKQLGDKSGYHRILSQNLRLSMDTRKTMRNNNIFCIGGSGAGKSMFLIKCNLMEMQGSFAATDPKGELLGSAGNYLKANGYQIKVFNLISPKESNKYNPFAYIRTETDVLKLITNLMKNTTPKKSSSSDPFWENSEKLFLQALFYYVWMEMPPGRKNIVSVLELLAEAKREKDEPSRLDRRMELAAVAFSTLAGNRTVSATCVRYFKYFLSVVMEAVTMALAILICNAFISAGLPSFTGGYADWAQVLIYLCEITFTIALTVGACKGAQSLTGRALGL